MNPNTVGDNIGRHARLHSKIQYHFFTLDIRKSNIIFSFKCPIISRFFLNLKYYLSKNVLSIGILAWIIHKWHTNPKMSKIF